MVVKTIKKVFIIGDLNLNSVSWPVGDNPNVINRIDRLFIDSFYELGLTQCISAPTHSKGKTLDVLLTNCAPLVCDATVLTDESICKSDHFPISFKVQCNIKNKKFPKRKIYNFKRANWDQLNLDLRGIPWNAVIDRIEPENAWLNFKSILFNLVNKHIPKITIKCDFDSPWFDSECYEAYRNKERAHKHFKRASNLDNELNKNSARRVFRNTCDKKMRDNLYNSDDPALITKKFWSHVKFNSKSRRLPECMYLNGRYRSLPVDKAELFNNYFFDQFSDASQYDVEVDWSNDNLLDIDFCHSNVRKLFTRYQLK